MRHRQAQGAPGPSIGAGSGVEGVAGAAAEVPSRGLPRGAGQRLRPGGGRPRRTPRSDGQAGRRVQRVHRAAWLGPRLRPPGDGAGPVPARPERRHHHPGRAGAAACRPARSPVAAVCCGRSPGPGRRRCTPGSASTAAERDRHRRVHRLPHRRVPRHVHRRRRRSREVRRRRFQRRRAIQHDDARSGGGERVRHRPGRRRRRAGAHDGPGLLRHRPPGRLGRAGREQGAGGVRRRRPPRPGRR